LKKVNYKNATKLVKKTKAKRKKKEDVENKLKRLQ
jgi:hypothetical protein